MLINTLIAFPFLLLLPQEQPEKSLYPLKTLNSLIGNPNHPHMALSPDNKMELFVEDIRAKRPKLVNETIVETVSHRR